MQESKSLDPLKISLIFVSAGGLALSEKHIKYKPIYHLQSYNQSQLKAELHYEKMCISLGPQNITMQQSKTQ